MIERLIQPASTFAGDIDQLFFGVHALIGFWFLLVQGMFFYLMYRYRYQEGVRTTYVTGKEKHLKRWITIPHALVLLCDVFIVIGAVRVWYDVKLQLPEPDATVRVIGQQWAWVFQHPGADNELDTDDDIFTTDELHVQNDRTYHFQLQSRDVMHSFSVPEFRLKQDAVPGRTITGWFTPIKAGIWDIQCAEMCGVAHGIMRAAIHVESAEDHDEWMLQNTPSKSLVVLPKKKVAAVAPAPAAVTPAPAKAPDAPSPAAEQATAPAPASASPTEAPATTTK